MHFIRQFFRSEFAELDLCRKNLTMGAFGLCYFKYLGHELCGS